MPQQELKEHYCFQAEGRKFVYDVNDIVIYEIDEPTWDYYQAAQNPACSSPLEELFNLHGAEVAAEVLEELRQMGLLVQEREGTATPTQEPGFKYRSVTLNVAHDCNLRCTYCFANQGDYRLGRALMDAATAQKAIDWLAAHRDDTAPVRIDFFGGEPMLNMKTIKSSVTYANAELLTNGKPVRYYLTTNGTLLNKNTVDFIAAADIHVQVSLDGPPAVNDRFRVFANGRGSYEAVRRGIRHLKEATPRLSLRATISPEEPHFSNSLFHMTDELEGTFVTCEPSSTPQGLVQEAATAIQLEILKAEWDKVAEHFAEHIKCGVLKPFGNLTKLLLQIHKRKKIRYGCTVGYAQIAVDPSGDIYPCHRFVGEKDWLMGNIHAGSFNEGLRARFVANSVEQRESCKHCWARYLCGGRCAYEAWQANGDIAAPDSVRCDLMRHVVDLCLKLYVRLKSCERSLIKE